MFSYDINGNISSGAVVSVDYNGGRGTIENNPTIGTSTDMSLRFIDFELVQNNQRVVKDDLDTLLPLTIRIAYAKLPEHLKTITVTFRHPNDSNSTFSFLLRINKDKTFYEAAIAPLLTEGKYPVIVAVFDHQTQKLFSLQDTLYAHKKLVPSSDFGQAGTSLFSLVVKIGVLVLSIVSIWLLIFYRVLRRVKAETK